MRDPYRTLGIPRDAGHDAIKQAYRRLAMELHPDRNPDTPEVADKFKDVNAAYALIGDPHKRARFDRGEIDAWGRRRPKPPNPPKTKAQNSSEDHEAKPKTEAKKASGTSASPHKAAKPQPPKNNSRVRPQKHGQQTGRDGAQGTTTSRWLGSAIKADDLFGPFRSSKSPREQQSSPPSQEATHKLRVTFIEAAQGTTKRLTAGRGRTLDVLVPAGIRDGQIIRLKDQAIGRLGRRTDALVKIDVTPHKVFRAEGDDVHLEVPITLEEAVLGARIRVPTVNGSVEVTIPSGANSGAQLRLRGKGLRRPGSTVTGDQVIRLVIKLPQTVDSSLKAFVRERQGHTDFDPRQNLASV
jgi:DnaJ-class molecular chaperone